MILLENIKISAKHIKKLLCGKNNPIISDGVYLHSSSVVIGASVLIGEIQVGQYCRIENSTLKGKIKIGRNCKILGPLEMYSHSNIVIDDYTSLNGPMFDIYARLNSIYIGKFCSIARKTSIQEYNHNYNTVSTYFMQNNLLDGKVEDDIVSKGDIEIGNDVWIGANCTILSGSRIGNGSVIGANSVVSGEVEPYSVFIGNTSVKKRFDIEIVSKLLEIQWWNWSPEKIKRNRDFFTGDLNIKKFRSIVE